jgi:cytochrome c-type biogenesis protein CcmH/NrfF
MSAISKLTKDEMINYLYVRDLIRGGDDNITEKLDYTNIMLYLLPFILVLILILVIYLIFIKHTNNKQNTNEKKIL